jgi:hypothetical protein
LAVGTAAGVGNGWALDAVDDGVDSGAAVVSTGVDNGSLLDVTSAGVSALVAADACGEATTMTVNEVDRGADGSGTTVLPGRDAVGVSVADAKKLCMAEGLNIPTAVSANREITVRP